MSNTTGTAVFYTSMRNIPTLLFAAFVVGLCAGPCGCARFNPDAGIVAATGIGGAADDIDYDLAVVIKHVDTIGKPYVESAQRRIPIIKAGAAKVIDNANKLENQVKVVTTRAEKAESGWALDKDNFWSYRQRHLFWWIVGSIAAIVGIVALLCFLTPFAPVILNACVWLMHICSLGITWVASRAGTGIKKWMDERKAKEQAAIATRNQVAATVDSMAQTQTVMHMTQEATAPMIVDIHRTTVPPSQATISDAPSIGGSNAR